MDWGAARRPVQGRPGARASSDTDWGTTNGRQEAPAPGARAGSRPQDGATDWGVGRGDAGPSSTPAQRARSPWPAAVRRRRIMGVLFALLGLVLATSAAMILSRLRNQRAASVRNCPAARTMSAAARSLTALACVGGAKAAK